MRTSSLLLCIFVGLTSLQAAVPRATTDKPQVDARSNVETTLDSDGDKHSTKIPMRKRDKLKKFLKRLANSKTLKRLGKKAVHDILSVGNDLLQTVAQDMTTSDSELKRGSGKIIGYVSNDLTRSAQRRLTAAKRNPRIQEEKDKM
jgi:hypothetical protein